MLCRANLPAILCLSLIKISECLSRLKVADAFVFHRVFQIRSSSTTVKSIPLSLIFSALVPTRRMVVQATFALLIIFSLLLVPFACTRCHRLLSYLSCLSSIRKSCSSLDGKYCCQTAWSSQTSCCSFRPDQPICNGFLRCLPRVGGQRNWQSFCFLCSMLKLCWHCY